jgi:hypothetical protein
MALIAVNGLMLSSSTWTVMLTGYGTFADPVIPPTGACVLDGILAIKHKLDEYNRLVERKLRLCAHGGQ